MPKIKILPENVARKIAAGEVIERPASVVKELCENAFDAGAHTVEIEIWEGGLSLIRVRDDGCGMSPEDLKICYLPHATSKIEKEDDLLRIRTWGFRGEALASIAQVSELTISSREKSALIGAKLKVRFGREVSFVESGLAPGTIVEVASLFANVPARRAFLKSPRAETMRVSEIAKLLALENPQVDLVLKSAGKLIFNYKAQKGRLGLLAELAGLAPEDFLIEETKTNDMSLSIIISKAQVFFPSARYIYFLVNNRVIKDKLLMSAAFEGIKAAFPKGRYPALVLAVILPPELVDVNVHPAKWEVRFRREREVFSLVKKALENLFKPTVSFSKQTPNIEEDIPIYEKAYSTYSKVSFPETKIAETATDSLWDTPEKLEVLSRFGDEFFLILYEDELYIFDYHAAHERLLFERWKKELKEGVNIQKLLIPQIIDIKAAKVEEMLPTLNAIGFEIDFFGEDKLILRAYPSLLGSHGTDTLKGFLHEEENFAAENILEEVISRLSCRAARKAGEKLSPQEIKALFKEIRKRGLAHCPHGRPFYLKISLEDVRKKLGRKI